MNACPQVSQSDLRWFVSDGLYMAIDSGSSRSIAEILRDGVDYSPVSDLKDAVLLAEYELLLQCLDEWTGYVSEWRPVREARSGIDADSASSKKSTPESSTVLHELTHVPRITVALRLMEQEEYALFVCIALADLNEMPDLPEQWCHLVEIVSYVTDIQLSLQDWLPSDTDLEKLVPGAMVLLQNSYEQQWPVYACTPINLQASSAFEGVQIFLDQDSSSIRLLPCVTEVSSANSADKDTNTHAPRVSVCLQEPLAINRLYAQSIWQSGGAMVLALPADIEGSAANVTVHSSAGTDTSLQLPGAIVRLGAGLAILLAE